ncbi:FAD-dependent oxidoreductase [Hydrogenimonas sp. SS33]|uniref:NAD(P)/FAD-dependent oxidoreductase n=1 Tax=Hydrogenimonas leucolamina TaxID=2954236 RepID=UPI00336BF7C8
MARVVIMGGGVAGHTTATFLGKWLGKEHEIIVVTPNSHWNWIPSNIWVGVGRMSKEQVVFPLAPVYKKVNVDYRQAKALSIHPEGSKESEKPYIVVEYTGQGKEGTKEEIAYDYLVNATGPKLNFDATEGLGDGNNQLGKHTVSVCTADHALHANKKLRELFERAKKGEKLKVVVGTGHGTCTCQGAAFEYILNIEKEARDAGVRENIELTWFSNEPSLGDFGMDSIHMGVMGYVADTSLLAESLFAERGIHWILNAHAHKIEEGKIHYELVDGTMGELEFDFAMLIPAFGGVGLKAYDKENNDITDQLFMSNGFMKVDADYTPKPYEEWKPSDWPKTYQSPVYKNIFAAGIAFAPPHPISKPQKSPNGTLIVASPPRTGMPSGTIGKAVAHSIRNLIEQGENAPLHAISMAEMGALCVASAGYGLKSGEAVSFTVYPLVKNFEKYPGTGRDTGKTFGTIGLAGHWIKYILHYMFIYKAKVKPGWTLIPE